jgi:hypothetical protein
MILKYRIKSVRRILSTLSVTNIFKVFKTKLCVGETFIRKNIQKRNLLCCQLEGFWKILKLGISYHNIRYCNQSLVFFKDRPFAYPPASKQLSPHLEYLPVVLICPSIVKIDRQGYFYRVFAKFSFQICRVYSWETSPNSAVYVQQLRNICTIKNMFPHIIAEFKISTIFL